MSGSLDQDLILFLRFVLHTIREAILYEIEIVRGRELGVTHRNTPEHVAPELNENTNILPRVHNQSPLLFSFIDIPLLFK